MQANFLKVLAMAAVVLTVQSAPTGTALSDVEINAAEIDAAKTSGVQADGVQADGVQASALPIVHLVRTLFPHNATYAFPSRD